MDASWVYSRAAELKFQLRDWLDTSDPWSETKLLPNAPEGIVALFEEYKKEVEEYKKTQFKFEYY